MRCTPLLPALLALAVTVSGAAAQQRASAQLFTRVEGDQVTAAIEVAIEAGYHLYHDDLGDYVGEPTAVEGLGEDVEWTSWTLPKPKSGYDPFLEQFYDKHEGTIVIHHLHETGLGQGIAHGGRPGVPGQPDPQLQRVTVKERRRHHAQRHAIARPAQQAPDVLDDGRLGS